MNRPLVALTIAYCSGIVLNKWWRINFWVMVAVALAVLICILLGAVKQRLFLVCVLLLALLIGYLSQKNAYQLPSCHVRKLVAHQNCAFYQLNGTVVSQPELKNNHLWFILKVRQIQVQELRYKCCGDILVKMDFELALEHGDGLTLVGSLSRPPVYAGSRSYRDFLFRQGIFFIAHIQDARQIIRVQKATRFGLINWSLRVRAYLEQLISRHLAPLPASILAAMVLGQKRDIPWLVNDAMVKSGTVHILVVSGFNVGIVALMINLLLKILHFRRRPRIVLTALCLVGYCLITGSTNPVLRATVMGLIFLFGYFFKRQPDIYNSLFSAALFILVVNPGQLFDIGFQLSFSSVLAIVYFYPKLEAGMHLDGCRIKVLKFMGAGCLVSVSAWLGTLPIIAVNFKIISLITVLANIFIVPLATLITLSGFTLVFFALINQNLAPLFTLPITALITLLLNINLALIKLPFAYIYL